MMHILIPLFRIHDIAGSEKKAMLAYSLQTIIVYCLFVMMAAWQGHTLRITQFWAEKQQVTGWFYREGDAEL